MSPAHSPLQGRTPLNEHMKSAKPTSNRTKLVYHIIIHTACGGKGCRPCLGLIAVRRKIASLFAGFTDIKRTRYWKCGAVWVCAFDEDHGFGAFTVFLAAPHFGVGLFGARLWIGWVFFVTYPLQGAPRPLDPSAKLARLATASIDTRFSFVWERNKQGSCRRQLLGNSAKPTFHASLHPALFNSVPLCYHFYFAPANIF